MSQLSIMREIRKPATPPSNRHEGRSIPRPTKHDVAAMLEEEMDEVEEPNGNNCVCDEVDSTCDKCKRDVSQDEI